MTLFGTDGIRGEAGRPPLDEASVRAIGRALGVVLGAALDRPPRVAMGRDTRESGPDLVRWLADGLARSGATARSAGVVPTPAVAHLARQPEFDAGIMVSASHNPWRDNGIKIFSHGGVKLDDALERATEAALRELAPLPPSEAASAPDDEPVLRDRHAAWLVDRFRPTGGLGGLSVVVDSAHGAAAGLAADVLGSLGARVTAMGDAPDGRNINEGCGSVHPEKMAALVAEVGADAGVALDGDADRCILSDATGRIADGDNVLLACADALAASGRLAGGGVVGTVMSNLGLERALKARGLTLVRERVGDRSVLERMRRDGFNLGGEPSGHLIFLDDAPAGDGLLTALHVLTLVARGRSLAELADLLPRTPQVLRNVRVARRLPLDQVDGHAALINSWMGRLGDEGRVLVRWSGTEPLVRVMVEGTDPAVIAACAGEIAEHLLERLGGA